MSTSADSGSDRPRRRLARWIQPAVAVALLAALFTLIPPSEVLSALTAAHPGLLAAAVVFGFAIQAGTTLRVRPLLFAQGLRFSTLELLEINLSALFYGLFLPAGNFAGIALRFYRMGSLQKNYSGAAVMLVFDRLIATASLCVVGVGAWALVERPGASGPMLAVVAGALGVTLGLQAALVADLPFPARLGRIAGGRLAGPVERLRRAQGVARDLPGAVLLRVAAVALLTQLLGVAAYTLIAAAVGLELSLATVAWARSAALLLAILPVSVSGLGLREGALVALLAPYGVAAADAMAFSLAGFTATTVVPALLGGVLEIWRFCSRSASRVW